MTGDHGFKFVHETITQLGLAHAEYQHAGEPIARLVQRHNFAGLHCMLAGKFIKRTLAFDNNHGIGYELVQIPFKDVAIDRDLDTRGLVVERDHGHAPATRLDDAHRHDEAGDTSFAGLNLGQ